jgi:hypothetical protein
MSSFDVRLCSLLPAHIHFTINMQLYILQIALGTAARYLPDDTDGRKRVTRVMRSLLRVLSTPVYSVQEAVARCAAPLAALPAVTGDNDAAQALFDQLLTQVSCLF